MTIEKTILSRLPSLTLDSQRQVLDLIESLVKNQSSHFDPSPEITARSVAFSPVDSSSADWEKAMKQISENQPQSLGELLRSWEDEGTPEEQRETWEFLHQALDKDRISNRSLFP
jgi:hypothetical protein